MRAPATPSKAAYEMYEAVLRARLGIRYPGHPPEILYFPPANHTWHTASAVPWQATLDHHLRQAREMINLDGHLAFKTNHVILVSSIRIYTKIQLTLSNTCDGSLINLGRPTQHSAVQNSDNLTPLMILYDCRLQLSALPISSLMSSMTRLMILSTNMPVTSGMFTSVTGRVLDFSYQQKYIDCYNLIDYTRRANIQNDSNS